MIDTLRADHLSLYGYPRETSPNLDALAASGWTFENHISHAGQTVPATISMLVSQLPAEHGHVHTPGVSFAKYPPLYPPERVFLAEVFAEAGYETAAFVANPFLTRKNRFDQGFDHFVYRRRSGKRLNREVLDWMAARDEKGPSPFFAYVHYMDVHSPYEPPKHYDALYPKPQDGKLVYRNGRVKQMSSADLAFTIATYDAQINQVDDMLQELLDQLDVSGLRDETIVVVTSDHGDEFMEHGGLGHGTSVYGELVRVPLVVAYPAGLAAGRRVTHQTQHLDLAPSILEAAGLEPPGSFRGQRAFPAADPILLENGRWRAVYSDGAKLISKLGDRRGGRLYLASDRLDLAPILDPRRRARLEEMLRTYADTTAESISGPQEATTWTDEEIQHLRELGYAE